MHAATHWSKYVSAGLAVIEKNQYVSEKLCNGMGPQGYIDLTLINTNNVIAVSQHHWHQRCCESACLSWTSPMPDWLCKADMQELL